MSALSRVALSLAKVARVQQQHRSMASATTTSDPIQRLFVDKVREFKNANKGLDEAHQKMLTDELARLKRVYKVEDESKLSEMSFKFDQEVDVDLRDVAESKTLRASVSSGEHQKQLSAEPKKPSPLLASIPDQTIEDMHLPPPNKPEITYILDNFGVPKPLSDGQMIADYNFVGDSVTVDKLQRDIKIRFGPNMPTIHDDKAPERDVVNFPRIPQREDSPPTRYHIVPESWFRFLYPKTGVTGPYVFAGSLTTFLFSKEWLVFEHELFTAFTSTAIFTYGVTKYGPKLSGFIRDKIKTRNEEWEQWRKGNAEFLEGLQNHYKAEINKADLINEIYDIRNQDVQVQVELQHRNRLATVYADTLRRLNYLVAVADSNRQIAQTNMVNWVISNAVSSIGPKQEADALDSCIANLKNLAVKNQNVV